MPGRFPPSAESPQKLTGLKSGRIKKTAAGIPAVISTVKHIIAEAGIIRGVSALNKMNQKNGFDCPSCAWPDPDDERSGIAEYCENGAKAVAEEATLKVLTPSYFRQHSVSQISLLSDMELSKKEE